MNTTRLKFAVVFGGIVTAVVLIAVAAVFANAYGARRAGEDAAALHNAETLLSSSAILRAQLGQLALVTTYEEAVPTAEEAAPVARGEADSALASVQAAFASYAGTYPVEASGVGVLAGAYFQSAQSILVALDEGRIEEANAIVAGELNGRYLDLIERVRFDRDRTVNDLAEAQTNIGRISEISRFLVAFLIPSIAILLYRWAANRQQRQRELETRLEAQRELTRAKDEFVANVSHELRTPLTSIYGFSQLLVEGGTEDRDTTRDLLYLIRSETDELSRMVEDLLTAARADAEALSFHLEDFSVSDAVTNATEALVKAGNDYRIEVEDAIIHADDFRFRQIIRNLLSNARKYGAEPIGIRGRVDGLSYRLVVFDSGQGVPDHVSERLFQRFVHQGHQPLLKGSVGLGLSIVRVLAEGMNGAVGYERADGETRFVVTMPLAHQRRMPTALAG